MEYTSNTSQSHYELSKINMALDTESLRAEAMKPVSMATVTLWDLGQSYREPQAHQHNCSLLAQEVISNHPGCLVRFRLLQLGSGVMWPLESLLNQQRAPHMFQSPRPKSQY